MVDLAAEVVAYNLEDISIKARRDNEQHAFQSLSDKAKATRSGTYQAAANGLAGACGIAGGAAVGLACGSPDDGALLGGVLMIGAAAGLTAKGDAKARLKAAAETSGRALGCAGASAVADRGVQGMANLLGSDSGLAGTAALLSGKALGAALEARGKALTEDEVSQGLRVVRNAAAEAAALEVVKLGMEAVIGSAAPLPREIVNEPNRKGIEFCGGHSISYGTRQKSNADGSRTTRQQGTQFRVGGGIVASIVGGASMGPVGVAIGNAVGSLVGVGGNIGETVSTCVTQLNDGSLVRSSQTLKGFCGGLDIVGVEWLNLDTGRVWTRIATRDLCGNYSLEQFRKLTVLGLEIPRTRKNELDWRDLLKKSAMVQVFTRDGGIPRWTRAVVISTRMNNISVKFDPIHNGDGEIFSVIPRSSVKMRPCRVDEGEQQNCKEALRRWPPLERLGLADHRQTQKQQPSPALVNESSSILSAPNATGAGLHDEFLELTQDATQELSSGLPSTILCDQDADEGTTVDDEMWVSTATSSMETQVLDALTITDQEQPVYDIPSNAIEIELPECRPQGNTDAEAVQESPHDNRATEYDWPQRLSAGTLRRPSMVSTPPVAEESEPCELWEQDLIEAAELLTKVMQEKWEVVTEADDIYSRLEDDTGDSFLRVEDDDDFECKSFSFPRAQEAEQLQPSFLLQPWFFHRPDVLDCELNLQVGTTNDETSVVKSSANVNSRAGNVECVPKARSHVPGSFMDESPNYQCKAAELDYQQTTDDGHCYEGGSELTFHQCGAWDVPLSHAEKVRLSLLMHEGDFVCGLDGIVEPQVTKVLSTDLQIPWEFPMSRTEKIQRLHRIYLL